jgi:diguanylate cyclase (GGDEF)-like protein
LKHRSHGTPEWIPPQVRDRSRPTYGGARVGSTELIGIRENTAEKCSSRGHRSAFGCDEFCVLLTGHSMPDAKPFLERIRHEFSQKDFVLDGQHFTVTASFSMTDYAPEMTVKQCLQSVDEALYQAKAGARNEASWSQ